MIVKIQDDNLQDKHLIEAARIRWNEGGKVLDCFATLETEECTKIRLAHGDRIFFMNDQGQTVDSKRIDLSEGKQPFSQNNVTVINNVTKPECTHDDLQN